LTPQENVLFDVCTSSFELGFGAIIPSSDCLVEKRFDALTQPAPLAVQVYGHTLAQRVEFGKKLPHSTSESYAALGIGFVLCVDKMLQRYRSK
jgi:hypothetical protein